mmetsp:Transcript_21641/g.60058  ORF Transcript_21641/g.60058 Transcript_21641/m.60058 type:complete len:237 (+) Transcript_21641:263-973(+)
MTQWEVPSKDVGQRIAQGQHALLSQDSIIASARAAPWSRHSAGEGPENEMMEEQWPILTWWLQPQVQQQHEGPTVAERAATQKAAEDAGAFELVRHGENEQNLLREHLQRVLRVRAVPPHDWRVDRENSERARLARLDGLDVEALVPRGLDERPPGFHVNALVRDGLEVRQRLPVAPRGRSTAPSSAPPARNPRRSSRRRSTCSQSPQRGCRAPPPRSCKRPARTGRLASRSGGAC